MAGTDEIARARIALADEITRVEALLKILEAVDRRLTVPHACAICKTETSKETGR